jgi:hypothetical protein
MAESLRATFRDGSRWAVRGPDVTPWRSGRSTCAVGFRCIEVVVFGALGTVVDETSGPQGAIRDGTFDLRFNGLEA